MAQDLQTSDPRTAAWEARLRTPVLVAAFAVLPLVALSLTHPRGVWHTVEIAGHWGVWLVFVVEVAVMLNVVSDRRAWIGGHRFELLVVLVSSPVIPLALALVPALRLLVVVKALKAVKLAKLGKSVRLLRRMLVLRGAAEFALGAVAIALAALTVGYMVTGESALKGAERTVAFVVAGTLASFGVNHLRSRSAATADAQSR